MTCVGARTVRRLAGAVATAAVPGGGPARRSARRRGRARCRRGAAGSGPRRPERALGGVSARTVGAPDATPRAVYIGNVRRSAACRVMLAAVEGAPGWLLDVAVARPRGRRRRGAGWSAARDVSRRRPGALPRARGARLRSWAVGRRRLGRRVPAPRTSPPSATPSDKLDGPGRGSGRRDDAAAAAPRNRRTQWRRVPLPDARPSRLRCGARRSPPRADAAARGGRDLARGRSPGPPATTSSPARCAIWPGGSGDRTEVEVEASPDRAERRRRRAARDRRRQQGLAARAGPRGRRAGRELHRRARCLRRPGRADGRQLQAAELRPGLRAGRARGRRLRRAGRRSSPTTTTPRAVGPDGST